MAHQKIQDKLAKIVLTKQSILESELGRELTYLEMCRTEEDVLLKWMETKKYDDLIDYVLYQYECDGGKKWWQPLRYDLENDKDIKRIKKLLTGLLPCRLERFKQNHKHAKQGLVGNITGASDYKYQVLDILNEYFQSMSRLGEKELTETIKNVITSLYEKDSCSIASLLKASDFK